MSTPYAAEFSQSRNDMHWKFWAGPDGFIRWTGYDDANWRKNVAASETARQRVGKVTGRVFTIDFESGGVTIAPVTENSNG